MASRYASAEMHYSSGNRAALRLNTSLQHLRKSTADKAEDRKARDRSGASSQPVAENSAAKSRSSLRSDINGSANRWSAQGGAHRRDKLLHRPEGASSGRRAALVSRRLGRP